MLPVKRQLVHDIGEDAFERIRKERIASRHPDARPGWLEMAIVLAHYFAPAPAWASSTSIIALIKQSTVDCKRAIDVLDEKQSKDEKHFELRLELHELLEAFRLFFLHNGLAEPEA